MLTLKVPCPITRESVFGRKAAITVGNLDLLQEGLQYLIVAFGLRRKLSLDSSRGDACEKEGGARAVFSYGSGTVMSLQPRGRSPKMVESVIGASRAKV